MSGFNDYQTQTISHNINEYGENYSQLKWLSRLEARTSERTREHLLSELEAHVIYGFKQTKADCRQLSEGCRLCGSGEWSCLFINGICNCRCFYCPTEQTRKDVPTTQTIQFTRAFDYADYIEKMQFKGVSISGGEPFLSFGTSLKYISAVRKRMGEDVHIWLYTNGTLSRPELLEQLKHAGLDEIRFDIGATHYHLGKAKEAVGVIPVVTVEIPAIPEDMELLKDKIKEMADAGISHLNLHQLRLTPFNFEKLKDRNYTFLHGERVTVLDSELTALKLLQYSFESQIPLPINYCTFHYKHSFQRAAVRRKCARFVIKPHEDLTENGYIRCLFLVGETSVLSDIAGQIQQRHGNNEEWKLSGGRDRLYIKPSLIEEISYTEVNVKIVYYEPRILSSVSYRNEFVKIPLNKSKTIIVEKTRISEELELKGRNLDLLLKLISDLQTEFRIDSQDSVWNRIMEFEIIRPGFQPYY